MRLYKSFFFGARAGKSEGCGLTRNIRVGGVWVGNGACVTIYSI